MNSSVVGAGRQAPASDSGSVPLEHYARLLLHRSWLVIGVWLLVSLVTAVIAYRLPDVFMSETLILVDPQKVPESYVKSTVTGDIRNRLGTLSQQILSATRLQRIIESQNLYAEERAKGVAREDIISKMRSDISVHVVSDFGGGQDLQAFKIAYSGREPRLVALVTNQLASLFIEENLKARELQATGTTDFLANQLQETRKKLEEQEAKLRDFKLKHVGEMPAQETADLQLLGQAQSQLQLESEAISRGEQQKNYIQSMMTQSTPVVEIDEESQSVHAAPAEKGSRTSKDLAAARAQLALLRSRYTENHPDVQKLKSLIEEAEAKESAAAAAAAAAAPARPPSEAPVKEVREKPTRPPVNYSNPVLQSQMKALEGEIARHKEEQLRLSKIVSLYRSRLDAIPVREQEISELERDYQISRSHYGQLLDKQLSAQTATELEIRQKGEKFATLDLALPAERPSRPNRTLINLAGSIAGLILGLVLATGKEFVGMSIITHQDMTLVSSLPVLGEISVIRTQLDKRAWRTRILVATSSLVILVLACGAILFYRYRIHV